MWSPITSPFLRWLGYTTNSPINRHIQGFVHPLIVVRIANIAIPATACRGRHALHCCGASPPQTQILHFAFCILHFAFRCYAPITLPKNLPPRQFQINKIFLRKIFTLIMHYALCIKKTESRGSLFLPLFLVFRIRRSLAADEAVYH